MFNEFANRLVIKGNLIALAALRVGAGKSTEPTGSDLPVLRDAMDRPYIPGSTFKGVLRSRIESLVRAVIPDPAKGACLPTGKDEDRCLPANDIKKGPRAGVEGISTLKRRTRDKEWSDARLTEEIWKRSCLVCRTFGSPWLASHVHIKDLQVDTEIWFGQYQVRDGVAIDRDTETAAEGLLYDYEVIPSDVRFELEIVVENAKPWQLGMLVLGLKPFERGEIALGGFRSRGLGSVRLDWSGTYFEMKPGDVDGLVAFLQGEAVGEDAKAREQEWIEAFKDKLRDRAQGRD